MDFNSFGRCLDVWIDGRRENWIFLRSLLSFLDCFVTGRVSKVVLGLTLEVNFCLFDDLLVKSLLLHLFDFKQMSELAFLFFFDFNLNLENLQCDFILSLIAFLSLSVMNLSFKYFEIVDSFCTNLGTLTKIQLFYLLTVLLWA